MATISGGSAPVGTVVQTLKASFGNRLEFLGALHRAGLVLPDGTVNYEVVNNPGPTTSVDATKLLSWWRTLAPRTLQSNGPVLIGLGPNAAITLGGSGKNGNRAQADTVIGGSHANTIIGNHARSLLIGGTGREYIQSGGGRDTLVGGSGQNTLIGGGQSLIRGGAGAADITAGANARAHDTVFAGVGRDTIRLTDGNNLVVGPNGSGQSTIQAGRGSDTIIGGSGAATVISGTQTTLSLGTGDTKLVAPASGSINDTIYGGANTGTLSLNVASTAATVTPIANTDHATITFAGGNTITTVGTVNIVFSDHTKTTV